MFKAQFKRTNPYESWTTIGHYGNESAAISAALSYKNKGMLLVRVTDSKGSIVYTG